MQQFISYIRLTRDVLRWQQWCSNSYSHRLASILSLLALISTLMLSADTGFWVSGVKFPLATSFDPRGLSKIGPNVRRVSSRKSHQKGKKGTIHCKLLDAELPNICIASKNIVLHTNRSHVNHFY